MALGAYSVVRFSDSMRDERVNLGVIVWHPQQGFAHQIPNTLQRAKAVDSRLDIHDIRSQIAFVKAELESSEGDGRETLSRLSKVLREGFQITAPYPTRLSGVHECADHLFRLYVAPDQAMEVAHDEDVPVEVAFDTSLNRVARRIDPHAQVVEMGYRHILHVRVNIGTRTTVRNRNLLWRTVLLDVRRAEDQVARAKSAAMDIVKIKGLGEFQGHGHAVAVRAPAKTGDAFAEGRRWLLDQTKNVVVFRTPDELPDAVEGVLGQVA